MKTVKYLFLITLMSCLGTAYSNAAEDPEGVPDGNAELVAKCTQEGKDDGLTGKELADYVEQCVDAGTESAPEDDLKPAE